MTTSVTNAQSRAHSFRRWRECKRNLCGIALLLSLAVLAPALAADAPATADSNASASTNPNSAANPDASASTNADDNAGSEATTARAREAQRLFGAVVKVRTVALPGARSTASLGLEREGTGIVIGEDGLILTIGYLIVEAGEVTIIDARGRTFPAMLVGYDQPTGLGLLRAVVPLQIPPIALGESGKVQERDPVMIVNHGGRDDAGLAFVVSRRPFTANWEYALEQAIFTAPPTLNWSGAALIGRDGRLLGVGSLIVRDAVSGERAVPGNMFVPIDLIKPVLQDLVKNGRRAGAARPWLGLNADEIQGRLFVARVSPEGPAERAGIQAGDIILGVGRDGVHTQGELYARVWSSGAAGVDIPLRVLHDLDVIEIRVKSIDRLEYFRPRTAY